MRISFEIKPLRPSSIVRGIENAVIGAGRKVGDFGHAVSVEYKARNLARMATKVTQYKEQREVINRFEELRRENGDVVR